MANEGRRMTDDFTEMTRTTAELKEYLKDIFELLCDHELFMGVHIDRTHPNTFTISTSDPHFRGQHRGADITLSKHLVWMSFPLGDLPRYLIPITPASSLTSRILNMYVTCRLKKGV